jgi:hypothetical protein
MSKTGSANGPFGVTSFMTSYASGGLISFTSCPGPWISPL